MSAAATSDDPPATTSRWRGVMPVTRWLRTYQPVWFRADLAAGVTLAAYLLPAALGDASLANLPPQAGIYACLFGGLVFWLFCSSRQTVITVTSAISLLIGSSLSSASRRESHCISRARSCQSSSASKAGTVIFGTPG